MRVIGLAIIAVIAPAILGSVAEAKSSRKPPETSYQVPRAAYLSESMPERFRAMRPRIFQACGRTVFCASTWVAGADNGGGGRPAARIFSCGDQMD